MVASLAGRTSGRDWGMQGLCWWAAGSGARKRQTLGREKEADPVVWHWHRTARGLSPAKEGEDLAGVPPVPLCPALPVKAGSGWGRNGGPGKGEGQELSCPSRSLPPSFLSKYVTFPPQVA